MDRERVAAHVAELGERLGIPGVELDVAGMVTLALDDGARLIHIGHNQPAGTLDLMLCLDDVVPSGAALSQLLAANFAWAATMGAVLALEPSSGALVVQRRCGEEALTAGLAPVVESLLAVGDAWAARLGAANGSDAGPDDPGARGLAGMIRA